MNTKNCKEQLINVTISLINENGGDVDKVTIRDITSRSGVSVGLINYHFGNKDNLITACVQSIITGMIKSFKPNIEVGKGLPPFEAGKARIIDTACEVFEFLFANPSISRISILNDHAHYTERTNTYYCVRGVCATIGDAIKDPIKKELFASALVASMQSAFLRGLNETPFLGYDFTQKEGRNRYIADLVNALMKE